MLTCEIGDHRCNMLRKSLGPSYLGQWNTQYYDAECKALLIYTTIEPQILNENFPKIDTASTKSYDLEDQQKKVELVSENFDSVLNLKEPFTVNSNLIDLNNNAKVDLTTLSRTEVQITPTEIVGIDTIALINEFTNKNRIKNVKKSAKLHDLDDQQEEMELEFKNFEPIPNPTKSLQKNTKEKNILIGVKPTKDLVMRDIDNLLIDLNHDVKEELTTLPQPATQRIHREGVRMNTSALRREMYIKNR
ncbi:uncharacterized protein LOC112604286, partial [Melanaphis sacchari]|uniref:uncharacterized protein LOC112604286 n=1 Tax=Melanaphis sacchari TaxID=742174 RepID=UPI000DC150B6